MRIMIVTTKIPYPPNDGARIRTFNILKQLARRHEVVLFTFVNAEEELAYVDFLKQICTDVHYVRRSRSSLRRLVEIVLSPFRPQPYMVTVYTSRALHSLIADYDGRVDVAQAEFPDAAQYIRALSCRKVLDEHNVESDLLLQQSEHETRLLRKLFFYLQYRKMRKYEVDVCRSMDMIFATSGDDEEKLKIFNERTFVVPNGVDIDGSTTANPEQDRVVVFVGWMRYVANVDAVRYFLNEVWPIIKAEEPECRFWIVGKDPPAELQDMRRSDVVVTGAVVDVRPYIQAASVFVVPLRIGSGTRLKILEAMACGKPVVSTSLGCMGLDVHDGKNIYIADLPKIFAHQVVSLLKNAEQRRKIGEEGRALVASRYTWDNIGEIFGDNLWVNR